MAHNRADMDVPPSILQRVLTLSSPATPTSFVERSAFVYMSILSLSATLESHLYCPSDIIALLDALIMASQAEDSQRRESRRLEVRPNYMASLQATLALSMIAATNYLEGNNLSFVVAFSGISLSLHAAVGQYGYERSKNLVTNTVDSVCDRANKAFHACFNLFGGGRQVPVAAPVQRNTYAP